MTDPVDTSTVLVLLLLNLLAAGPGIGGAASVGGLARPDDAGPETFFSTMGALRSFVTAFLSLNPPEDMSLRTALRVGAAAGFGIGAPPGGGGGGGGPPPKPKPKPGIGGGGGGGGGTGISYLYLISSGFEDSKSKALCRY